MPIIINKEDIFIILNYIEKCTERLKKEPDNDYLKKELLSWARQLSAMKIGEQIR